MWPQILVGKGLSAIAQLNQHRDTTILTQGKCKLHTSKIEGDGSYCQKSGVYFTSKPVSS